MGLFNLPPRLSFRKTHIPKAPKYQGITMPIEYAFTAAGKRYFRFVDPFSMPPIRSLKSVTFFEEVRMKITLEFIQEHCKAKRMLYANPNTIDIFKLRKLDEQLEERTLWKMPELSTLYKCASVTYFDEDESPSDYDFTYNNKKIEEWKKEPIEDFFLSEPMKRLFPFLNVPPETFRIYSQVVEETSAIQWDFLHSITSPPSTQAN